MFAILYSYIIAILYKNTSLTSYVRVRNHCLAGALAHLSALAAETAHALLLPLLAHAGVNGHAHFEGIVFFDTVRFQSALFQNVGAVHETNLMIRDEFRVLAH